MKTSWKLLAGALVLFAVAGPATVEAQAERGGQQGSMRGGGNRMVQMLLKDITLDSAQRARVEVIKGKYEKEFPAPTRGQEPDSAARASRREAMMNMTRDIREVLTAEQQQTFDKNLAEMRERMPRRVQRN